ncbi:MAG: alpha-isopropylmalate synthase regulatory domain-containing protein, partial [Candidatus Nanohaloarchaea archaeon]
DTDVFAIAESQISRVSKSDEDIDLKSVEVTTGNTVTPVATVRAEVDEDEKVQAEVGVGPVDAAMKAVSSLVGEERFDINEFHIDAISGGSDAVGNVRVKITDVEGIEANAQSSSEDITVASVQALVNAINHLERKRN